MLFLATPVLTSLIVLVNRGLIGKLPLTCYGKCGQCESQGVMTFKYGLRRLEFVNLLSSRY